MLSLAKFIKKEIELRENLVGTGFLEPPRIEKLKDADNNELMKADLRMTVLGKCIHLWLNHTCYPSR